MDGAFSLFRLFDVAFFVPGSAVYLALALSGVELGPKPDGSLTTSSSIPGILLAFCVAYVLGLTLHSIQSCLSRSSWVPIFRRKEPPPGSPWYQQLETARRHELATYFWYMRATCWNLATAAPLCTAIALFFGELRGGQAVAAALVTAAVFVALDRLGGDYHRAFRRAMQLESEGCAAQPSPSP